MNNIHDGDPAPHNTGHHSSEPEQISAHVHSNGHEVVITIDIADHCREDRPHPKPDPGQEVVYVLTIDGEKHKTSNPHPTGQDILALVGKTPEYYHLNQQHREKGEPKVLLVKADEKVDLTKWGVELFMTKHVEVTIIVNATPHVVAKEKLSFAEIVALAQLPSGPNVSYTLTFRKGHGNKPEGSLVEGDSIKVKNGMIFNVTATDKS